MWEVYEWLLCEISLRRMIVHIDVHFRCLLALGAFYHGCSDTREYLADVGLGSCSLRVVHEIIVWALTIPSLLLLKHGLESILMLLLHRVLRHGDLELLDLGGGGYLALFTVSLMVGRGGNTHTCRLKCLLLDHLQCLVAHCILVTSLLCQEGLSLVIWQSDRLRFSLDTGKILLQGAVHDVISIEVAAYGVL